MTTCLETFEKERFCSFPPRTRRSHRKTRDLRREMWEHQNEPFVRDFFHFLSIFTLCSFKTDVFLRVFVRAFKFATSKSMFRGRLPSIFSTSHKMPRLSHGICTLSLPMRFVKSTQHDASKVLRLPRKMTIDTSKVLRLPRKLQRIF